MDVFIDTNIYLKFYHYSNDELEELRKLVVLVGGGEITLYLTKQIENEYLRNRDTKIADALKLFKDEKISKSYPIFLKEYEEFNRMTKALHEYETVKKQLLAKAIHQIENRTLKADEIINELIQKAGVIEFEDWIIDKAKRRFDLGNPPGKNKSYGDAINWEILLENVPHSHDLYFISDDKDYFSEINNSNFNSFLEAEWQTRKSTRLIFFKSISDFFSKQYSNIKLASDLQKDMYISKFENSRSFRMSRSNLEKLSNLEGYSSDQVNKILRAALENPQIFNISEDFDINEMLWAFYDEYKELIEESLKETFNRDIPRLVDPLL